MQISESEAALRSFAKAKGIDVSSSADPMAVAEVWLAFYKTVRAEGTTSEEGSWPDALLFEWGTREALPGYYEACFYLNFTRQFISGEGQDDDAMFQLLWQLEYEPTEGLRKLGHRSEWCDGLSAFRSFKEFVLSCEVLQAVTGSSPSNVQFYLTGV